MRMFRRFRFDRKLKSRKVLRFTLVFVFIAISAMTVAYATLSSTLTISGSAEFKDASWDIEVEEVSIPTDEVPPGITVDGNTVLHGSAKLLSKPVLSGTSITNFNIEIGALGDQAMMYYTVTNNGEIPAMLDSVIWNEPTIYSESNNQDDIELVMENFGYTATMLYCGEETSCRPIDVEDIICPGTTVQLFVALDFDSDAPRVPYNKLVLSDFGMDLKLVAVDQNLCDGSTPVIFGDGAG